MTARTYNPVPWLTALAVVVLAVGSTVLERSLNADALRELGVARERIRDVIRLRRFVRDSQLALLERKVSRVEGGQAWVGNVAAQATGYALALELLPGEQADAERTLREIRQVVAAWAEAMQKAMGEEHLDVAALRARLDRVDAECEDLINLSSTSGAEVERWAQDLERRRRTLYYVSLAAVVAVLVLGARFYSQKEQLKARVLAAEAAREELRRMAASVGHEVNNQLGALQNSLHILKRLVPGEDALRYQEESLEQIEKLTRDFTEFSAPPRATEDSFDLVEVARAAASPFGAEVELVAAGPLSFRGDRRRFHAAVLNLVKNAVEAGGPVRLSIAREGAHVVVRCQDHGPGVAEAAAERIGEPFFTTKAKGTGLGVAIVKQLAAAHGGHFHLRSTEPKGAQAELWLPSP